MAETKANKSIPFLATERSLTVTEPVTPPPDGRFKVLATVIAGGDCYRVFADMIVNAGSAYLRLHRFDLPNGDDWFAERKINIQLSRIDLAPLEARLDGAEFILSAPVRLDEDKAAAFFGRWGPPVT